MMISLMTLHQGRPEPDLSVATNKSLEDTLKSLGVETPEDLKCLEESDQVAVLRTIQARKLISSLKYIY